MGVGVGEENLLSKDMASELTTRLNCKQGFRTQNNVATECDLAINGSLITMGDQREGEWACMLRRLGVECIQVQ